MEDGTPTSDDTHRLPFHEDYPYSLIVDDGWAELKYIANGAESAFMEVILRIDAEAPGNYRKGYFDGEGTVGWRDGPGYLWDFIEALIDHYQKDIDAPEELPLKVETNRMPDDRDDTVGEMCEVYIRDHDGGEYLMWNSDELWPDDEGNITNDDLAQTILVAIADAYEEPQSFLEKWSAHRVQFE